jgi:hypothetical protein
MKPGCTNPQFSIKAAIRHFPQALWVRIDFCDDGILFYDLNGQFLYRSEYSHVVRLLYYEPRAIGMGGGGLMGVGAPAMMSDAGILISILKVHRNEPRPEHGHLFGNLGKVDNILTTGSTNNISGDQTQKMFSWLRDKIISGGGKVE